MVSTIIAHTCIMFASLSHTPFLVAFTSKYTSFHLFVFHFWLCLAVWSILLKINKMWAA